MLILIIISVNVYTTGFLVLMNINVISNRVFRSFLRNEGNVWVF